MQPRPECPTRLVMVPFDLRESMSIAVAAKLSGKAGNTIRLWAERHGIGRKIGGDWHISRVAIRVFLDGDQQLLNTDAIRTVFRIQGPGMAPLSIH